MRRDSVPAAESALMRCQEIEGEAGKNGSEAVSVTSNAVRSSFGQR
ncbi:MAG: hypothetical protein AB2705_16230 [Candidatus Thiodiazotropha sp.]